MKKTKSNGVANGTSKSGGKSGASNTTSKPARKTVSAKTTKKATSRASIAKLTGNLVQLNKLQTGLLRKLEKKARNI